MIKNNIAEIQEILKLLPLLILYIAPGYIFFSLKKYMLVEKYQRDNYFLLSCLVVSYIIVHLEALVCQILKIKWDIYSLQFGIVAILISILGSYFFYFIADNDRCVKIFSFLGINKTVNSNIFDNTIDKHHGAWLRLYISEEKIIYTGELVYVNEHEGENNYYIVLKNYKRSMYDRAIDKTYQGNKNWVIISTEKVNRIEIIHGDNSSKINDVEKNKIKKIINFFKKFLPIKK